MSSRWKEVNDLVKRVLEDNQVAYHNNFTVLLGQAVARLTPVDTGKATANWNASIGSPDTNSKKVYDRSASSSPTRRKMQKSIKGLKKGDTTYISNGVIGEDDNGKETGERYIGELEFGKSKQAPFGMVFPTMARLPAISKTAKRWGS